MEEKFIYIMSCQRGQGLPEAHYMTLSYDDAIKVYYNHHANDDKGFLEESNNDSDYWFMYLYKFPLDINFDFSSQGWSDIKLGGKSSKYRIKFKTWGELKNEFKKVNREFKIKEIIE